MKSTFIAVIVFLAAFVIASPTAYAAESTFFGPIVPVECQSLCPCGYAAVLEVIRHLMNFAVTFGVIVVTIMLAWGGFLYILSAAKPESRSQANSLISGAVIGLLLVLGSWLIVDFIMRTLYSGPDGTAGKFGPWNSILAEKANFCIVAQDTKPLFGTLPFSQGPSTNPTNPDPNPNPPTTAGGTNCTSIPTSQLVTVDNYRLLASTAERYKAMKEAAAKDGITLVITSGYRSPEDQERAWKENGCSLVNGKAVCQTRTAAVPCSLGGTGSNHTRGTAVDIRLNGGVYDWLTRNASRFGFYNKLPNDLPHWSDTGR
ncbi:MAG: D-alanyl-D-alanine carboxypeptidase family protein [Patescibacteria group bacterium]